MDARPFDMLHDAGNQNIFPVTDRVDLQFGAHQVFVDEHRVFYPVRQDDPHILAHVFR